MDNVQWYTLWLIIGNLLYAFLRQGMPQGNADFRVAFIDLVMLTPVIGRIYGWW